jgi:hypothetical protein
MVDRALVYLLALNCALLSRATLCTPAKVSTPTKVGVGRNLILWVKKRGPSCHPTYTHSAKFFSTPVHQQHAESWIRGKTEQKQGLITLA